MLDCRILVAEDDTELRELLVQGLGQAGFEASGAATGAQLMERVGTWEPDALVVDVGLPDADGRDLCQGLRAQGSQLPVLFLTARDSRADRLSGFAAGGDDYVTKPFDLDEVHQIVERGIANRRLKAINRQLVEELREKNAILERHELELRERVQLATRQMTTLYEVGKEISANLELEPRLSLVAARSAEQIGAPAAVVYLRQPELEEFTPAAVHGFEWSVREVNAGNVIPHDGVLAPAAYEQQTVRLSPPPNSDSIAVPGLPGVRCRTLLALPLVSEGKTIGVLAVCDKVEDFSPEDESFLTLFASQAAIAILNSQLFEHTKSLDKLKSDFVAVVSHEIRTPLTSVKGAVELLGDPAYFKNTEQQQKLLAIAHANSDRLLVLINDILDFSKLESSSLPMNLERQQLEPVVQEAAHSMRTQLEERGIQLSVELPPELPDLHIDAGRVTQVITNLLSNAIKFSPQGGAIHISAALWEGAVRVSVRDHGEGIAPQNLPKLFRKFSQIDPSATRRAGGAGLGLVICKGIVEQHGGRIWVESAPGEGSIFHFTLPLEERTAPELAAN